jgi:hypothetical protein
MSKPILRPETKPAHRKAGVERRTAVRYSLNVPSSFCHPVSEVVNDARWTSARVHDISRSGIALLAQRKLPRGQLLALELEGVRRLLLAEVTHATAQEGHNWLVGCEFVAELSDEEFRNVVGDAS